MTDAEAKRKHRLLMRRLAQRERRKLARIKKIDEAAKRKKRNLFARLYRRERKELAKRKNK